MNAEYWPDHDTLYVSLANDTRNVESVVAEDDIVLNFNAQNHLVSIEIMNASQHAASDLIESARVRREPMAANANSPA